MEPLNPKFIFDAIYKDADKNIEQGVNEIIPHKDILAQLLEQIEPVDFYKIAGLTGDMQPSKEQLLVISIEQILKVAERNNWGMCRNHSFIYLYNSAYWKLIDEDTLKKFLGNASEKMGVDEYKAKYGQWCEQLYKQFMFAAYLPKPEQKNDLVLINFKNGTFEISPNKQFLREPRADDFLIYQLPFEYNTEATAPKFKAYLDKVQPDINNQKILAEYLGYLFIRTSILKLEKTLLLYGQGANGKSVFFEIVYAILGGENNVSNYSLQSLTNEHGYYRAMLANKLLNYASEINGKLETSFFKLLVSGEPIEARLPHGRPMIINDYAKLIFNCNELPKDVEQTHAYFRRFLIVPFDITIPEAEQDKELARKIIADELSGVFNWIIEGLKRLLEQRKFTNSEAVNKQLEDYKKQSDSVQLFLEEDNYIKDVNEFIPLKDLYRSYKGYCNDNGHHYCSNKTFGERLKNLGYNKEKKNYGLVVFVKKENIF